jgi:hypothetical protein
MAAADLVVRALILWQRRAAVVAGSRWTAGMRAA